MGRSRSLGRLPLTILFLAAAVLAVAVFVGRSDVGLADVKDSFEIDAEECLATGCSLNAAKAAYYADIVAGEDDWATENAIANGIAGDGNDDGADDCQTLPGGGSPQPVFLLCNGDLDAPLDDVLVNDCYGSQIAANPNITGTPVLLCDGNSSGTAEAEQDIVTSFNGCTADFPSGQNGQKTNNDGWCVATTGQLNNPAKTDETHGYVLINRPVDCDPGAGVNIHNFVLGGYERLSNSGSVFAGFVFAQEKPLDIDKGGGNKTINFDDPADPTNHFRNVGDLLVLLNQSGQNVTMQFSQATDGDSNAATVPTYPTPVTATAGGDPCGSLAVINAKIGPGSSPHISVLAPPWRGEFCDPSADPTTDPSGTNTLVGVGSNQCRLIGNTPPGVCTGADSSHAALSAPCLPGGDMVPPNDFVEWALDLTAEGLTLNPCAVKTVIMTSRSSPEFTADLKDVAEADVTPVCDTTVVTAIHNADHGTVTTVAVNTTVHDQATVTKTAETPADAPNPTGTVTFRWFTNGACSGTPAATSTIALPGSGIADNIGFTQTPAAAGARAFNATYNGDGNYPARTGACEPLTVVDAKIAIAPSDVNEVGETHTLTATVQQDKGDGLGFVAAPNGTCVVFTLTNSLGATATFTTPDDGNDCNSAGGNLNDCQTTAGTCSVTITSPTTGLTTINASTTFDIVTTQGTESVTRDTDPVTVTPAGPGGSGPAIKRWADAVVVTAIHNASHGTVTSVLAGTTVHDQATVTKAAGTPDEVPAPTGTVTFNWFTNGACTGDPAATSTIALPASGIADNTGFPQTPAVGSFAFNATYNGDSNYPARTSACEPLEVVPSGNTFPTQVSCEIFNTGTTPPLNTIEYTANGTINQDVAPGVFFYWSKFTIGSAGVLTVEQTNDEGAAYNFDVHNGWAKLYDGNCGFIRDLTVVDGSPVSVTSSSSIAAGTYIVGVKYDSKSIAGLTAPGGDGVVNYDYATKVGAAVVDFDPDGLTLQPK